jgi:hypothetical protein
VVVLAVDVSFALLVMLLRAPGVAVAVVFPAVVAVVL